MTDRSFTRSATMARAARDALASMGWWERPIAPSIRRSRHLRDTIAAMLQQSAATTHSARGATLRRVVEELEVSGIPYVLTAYPGRGYEVRSHPEWVVATERGDASE